MDSVDTKEELKQHFVIQDIPPSEVNVAYDIRQSIPEFYAPGNTEVSLEKFNPYPHGGILLGTYYEGKLVGYLSGIPFGPSSDKQSLVNINSRLPGKIFWADEVGVLPEYRNGGIMKSLDNALCDHARDQGYSYVCLRTWNLRGGVLTSKSRNGWYVVGMEEKEDRAHNRIDLAIPLDSEPIRIENVELAEAEIALEMAISRGEEITVSNFDFADRAVLHENGYQISRIDYEADVRDYRLHFKKQ